MKTIKKKKVKINLNWLISSFFAFLLRVYQDRIRCLYNAGICWSFVTQGHIVLEPTFCLVAGAAENYCLYTVVVIVSFLLRDHERSVNAFDYSFLRVIRFCFSVLSRT